MKYLVEISCQTKNDIAKHIKAGDKKLVKKVTQLIDQLEDHPRSGLGKPEQLKGYDVETWSRKINDKHRLIYEIRQTELVVLALSAYGHYDDK